MMEKAAATTKGSYTITANEVQPVFKTTDL